MELSNSAYVKGGRETWWRCHKPGFWTWYLVMMGFFAGVCTFGVAGALRVERKQEVTAHQAWVKLTGRSDITLEEWKALKNSGALNSK